MFQPKFARSCESLSKLGIPECGSQSLLKVSRPSRRRTAPALQGVAGFVQIHAVLQLIFPLLCMCRVAFLNLTFCGCMPLQKGFCKRGPLRAEMSKLYPHAASHWPWGTSASAPLGPPRKTTPAARSQRCPGERTSSWLQNLCVWHGVRSFWPLSWI